MRLSLVIAILFLAGYAHGSFVLTDDNLYGFNDTSGSIPIINCTIRVLEIAGGVEASGQSAKISVCPEGCGFTRLDEAVNAAGPGETIDVYTGTYREDLNLTKPLHFRSVGGPVNYEGIILTNKIPVTFDDGLYSNHFAFVNTNAISAVTADECLNMYKQGDYIDAILCYNDAIALNATNSDAWIGKGTVFYEMGKYLEARYNYEKAVELDPSNAVAWYNMGLALEALGEDKDAEAAFAQVRKLE